MHFSFWLFIFALKMQKLQTKDLDGVSTV